MDKRFGAASGGTAGTAETRLEPATCTQAEPFALRVLDDSMQPEFRRGCIILIDPTGLATDGSFVLAHNAQSADTQDAIHDASSIDDFIFRQLKRISPDTWELHALNESSPWRPVDIDIDSIVGVIVQRAGVRRSYHKHY